MPARSVFANAAVQTSTWLPLTSIKVMTKVVGSKYHGTRYIVYRFIINTFCIVSCHRTEHSHCINESRFVSHSL
jgi:hypothetical protein